MFNPMDLYIGEALDRYGEFSESEVEHFNKLVKPGMIVLDIGANIGPHTVVFSKLVKEGIVYAFEPQREIYYQLCGNIALNSLKNVFCTQAAISNESGHLRVPFLDYDKPLNSGGVSMESTWATRNPAMCYPVPVTRIDDLKISKVDFIKIDVEGMEIKVLQGAEETINRCRPTMWIERNPEKKLSEPVLNFLTAHGYWFELITSRGFNPDNFFGETENIFSPQEVSSFNYLATPKH